MGRARPFYFFFVVASCASIVSCGLWTPDYRDYTQSAGSGQPTVNAPNSAECTAALQEFTAQIEPAIDGKCIQCHVSTAIGGTKLIAKNPTNNRRAILAYAKGSSERFYDHYAQQNGEIHGGGALGITLAKANVDTWFTSEAACK